MFKLNLNSFILLLQDLVHMVNERRKSVQIVVGTLSLNFLSSRNVHDTNAIHWNR